jgi:23S rRNA pseudouridine955/2504/2580 synthase
MKELSKTSGVVRQVVGEEAASQRIDNYLFRTCKGIPKSHLYRILRSGQVRVNSKRVAPTYRLQAGDEVRIPPLQVAAAETPSPPPLRKFDVVFEDDHLIVLNKPAALAVHGGSGISFGVIEQLRHQRPQARSLELAHRLDRETSGLLVVAKSRRALAGLHGMLRAGTVEKRYLALVQGAWQEVRRDVRLSLHKYVTSEGERRVAVHPDGQAAHSIVRLVSHWENFSLLQVQLKTGRTHQIRVHLSHLGFPLCGDEKYGDFYLNKILEKLGLKRMFLHACLLAFEHPVTGERIELTAPLPTELQRFLEVLDAHEKRTDVAAI